MDLSGKGKKISRNLKGYRALQVVGICRILVAD